MSVPELAIVEISLEVNGIPVERAVVPRTLLVDFLREDLGMTGTKVSCELQVCGVCTVLVDDRPVSACTFLAVRRRRCPRAHRRGTCRRGSAKSAAGGLRHPSRAAMRILHSGFPDDVHRVARAARTRRPRGHRRAPGGQHLPLHRISTDHRRRRRSGRGSAAMPDADQWCVPQRSESPVSIDLPSCAIACSQ